SRQVSHQRRDAITRLQLRKGPLEERRLSGAGARNQAHHKHSRRMELFAQRARDHIILLQYVPPHFHQTWLAHSRTSSFCNSSAKSGSSISRANTCNSFPCTISIVGAWQSGQTNSCTDSKVCCFWHREQNTTTG